MLFRGSLSAGLDDDPGGFSNRLGSEDPEGGLEARITRPFLGLIAPLELVITLEVEESLEMVELRELEVVCRGPLELGLALGLAECLALVGLLG